MTELDFYKFITKNKLEYHWEINAGYEDVILFLNYSQLKDIDKLLSRDLFDEGGIICHWTNGCIGFWASVIADHYDLDLTKIFEK